MAVGSMTPGRAALLEGDFTQTVVSEQAESIGRSKWEIKAQPKSRNVQQLASGGWTLLSRQETVSNLQEVTDPTNSVIRAEGWQLAPGQVEVPTQRPPADLTDGTTGGAFSLASGGWHIEKQNDGGSWNQSLAGDQAAFPGPLSGTNLAQDRMGLSNTAYPDNAQFVVRFQDFANASQANDYIGTFYFGGPLFTSDAGGGGEFALSLTGDGRAELYSRLPLQSGTTWKRIAEFRATDPALASGTARNIHIVPYVGPDGPYLEIWSGLGDTAPPAGGSRNPFASPGSQARRQVFGLTGVMLNAALTDLTVAALVELRNLKKASGQGPIRYDLNRVSRARTQFSTRTFPGVGDLYDASFAVPLYATTRSNLRVSWTASIPPGTSVLCALYDAATDTVLSMVSHGDNFAEFRPVYGTDAYYAVFTLNASSDFRYAPILWSYRVVKDGVLVLTRAPLWSTPVTHWSVLGPGRDPQSESSMVHIEDAAAALIKLRRRGDVPVRLITTYPDQCAGNTANTVELARGFVSRNESTLWGSQDGQGMGGGGAPRSDIGISADARSIDCQIVPYYKRVERALAPMRVNLINDPLVGMAADGTTTPYKVTDIVRAALEWAGFQSGTLATDGSVSTTGEIDVPDASIRFWPAPGDSEDSLFVQPRSEIGPLILSWLQDYLGWHLLWDGNAGDGGMQRAIRPTVPNPDGAYNNVWHFTDRGADGTLPMVQGSYPAATSPILRGTYTEWTEAAEANMVEMIGIDSSGQTQSLQIVQYARNIHAADGYADSSGVLIETADPTHPDYTWGGIVLVTVIDPGLTSWDAVNWMTRRVYDRACHTLQFFRFETPLWLLDDPNDIITLETIDADGNPVYTTAPAYRMLADGTRQLRPLRYGDPVTLTRLGGTPVQCLVYSVHPGADKDEYQTQVVELVAAVPLTAT